MPKVNPYTPPSTKNQSPADSPSSPVAEKGSKLDTAMVPVGPRSATRAKAKASYQRVKQQNPKVADQAALPDGVPVFKASVVSVGGGPRATGTGRYDINLRLSGQNQADRKQIVEAGGQFSDDMQMIVDRRPETHIGRGNGWGPEQDLGTMNTGVEKDNVKPIQGMLIGRKDELAAQFKADNNQVAAAVFDSAFHPGHQAAEGNPVATHRGMMTRKEMGAQEHRDFLDLVAHAEQQLPGYHMAIMGDTDVAHIDSTSDPRQPAVYLADAKTKELTAVVLADEPRLNTGTPLMKPADMIKDAAVREHSFIGAMDQKALVDFLKSKGLADENGVTKPGTRILVGGTNLSFYDEAVALLATVPGLLKPNPEPGATYPHAIDPELATKYAGMLTAISRNDGGWIDVRNGYNNNWTQKNEPLISPREAHALTVHKDGAELISRRTGDILARGSVAGAMDMTLDEVARKGMTNKQVLAQQFAGSLKHLEKLEQAKDLTGAERQKAINESSQTLDGAKAQAFKSLNQAVGITRDTAASGKAMSQDFPATYAGRGGDLLLLKRAQLYSISQPGSESAADNAGLLDTHAQWMQSVTGSPPLVQGVAHLLMDSGVGDYRQADFGAIKANPGHANGGRALVLDTPQGGRQEYDAFVVVPAIQRKAEPLVHSQANQLKPVDPKTPNLPQVGAQRRQILADGRTSNVADYGSNGTGDWAGKTSKLNIFASDVNNRASSWADGPAMAKMRQAVEFLQAADHPDAHGAIEKLVAQHLPSHETYAAEVAKLEPHFDSAMLKASFVRPADKVAQGDGAKMGATMRMAAEGNRVKMHAALLNGVVEMPKGASGFKALSRQAEVDRSNQLHLGAARDFGTGRDNPPQFQPASRDSYFGRFVDVPAQIADAVYQSAHEMSLKMLGEKSSPSSSMPSSMSSSMSSQQLDPNLP